MKITRFTLMVFEPMLLFPKYHDKTTPASPKVVIHVLGIITAILTILHSNLPAFASQEFPLYPNIRANVDFWANIYGRYTTTQGVLHDKDDLRVVYTVIDLVELGLPDAGRLNCQRIEMAKKHYNDILAKLQSNHTPRTAEERKVAALFPKNKPLAFERAYNNIRLQIGQKDRFREGVIRSGAYLPALKKIFISYGLPPELAYLPHVESSFNLEAYSKAGAAGLWQFTRPTGKQFLIICEELDERRDPLASTHAAARFLKENHAQLDSWPLAITAYNYGRAGMVRAAKLYGSYENIFNHHQTSLFRFASRNFYPEFLAALRVAKQLEADPTIIKDRPEAIHSVRMSGYVALDDLCANFKLAKEDIIRLNPALGQPIIQGGKYIPKNFLIRLPAAKKIRLLADKIPSHLYRSKQVRDRFHTVQQGDTVASIARKYKIKTVDIILLNSLNQKAAICVGQRLQLPTTIAPTKLSQNTITIKQKTKYKPYN